MDRKWRITRFGVVALIVIAALFVVGGIEASGVLLALAGVLLLVVALAASGGGSIASREMGGSGYGPGYDPDGVHYPDDYDGD